MTAGRFAPLRRHERPEAVGAIRAVVERTARLRRIAATFTAEGVLEPLRTTLLRLLLDAERPEVPMCDSPPRDAEPVAARDLFELLTSAGSDPDLWTLDPDLAAHVAVVAVGLEREVVS